MLVTGPYSDLYFGPPRGIFNIKEKKVTFQGTGDEQISFTSMRDVGRLLVAALKRPTDLHERILKVNSFTATGKEALMEFEKQTGGNWEISYTPLEEVKRLEREAWEEDNSYKTGFTLRRIWLEGGTLYKERDNGKIGFEGYEEGLEEQVRKIIAKQE